MECTLVKSELLDEDNYLVTICRQDGSEVRVRIPREDSKAKYESDCIRDGKTFGLNLVTEGHYT
jgi:hypothetical protein